MKNKIFRLFLFGLILGLCLSACTPATATLSPAIIFTASAKTVEAMVLTQQATLKTVSAPATETPLPVHPSLAATLFFAPTQTAAASAPVAQPPVAASGQNESMLDKAEWFSQTPVDNTPLEPGAKFTLTWKIKNSGTTTWKKSYQFRYYAGKSLSLAGNGFSLGKDVAPGETIDLPLNCFAPISAGDYNTTWVLTNNEGKNFYSFYFQFNIATSITATSTSTVYVFIPTLTFTPQPTATSEPTATATTIYSLSN